MARAKTAAEIGSKWARVTPQRAPDYEEGVKNPRASWSASTTAAAERYKAGVVEAANKGRFAAGVTRAGDQRWAERAATIGPGRYAEGVATSEGQYQAAIAPYVEVINRTQLPPRYAKGDPRNLQRTITLAAALRAKKVGG